MKGFACQAELGWERSRALGLRADGLEEARGISGDRWNASGTTARDGEG